MARLAAALGRGLARRQIWRSMQAVGRARVRLLGRASACRRASGARWGLGMLSDALLVIAVMQLLPLLPAAYQGGGA